LNKVIKQAPNICLSLVCLFILFTGVTRPGSATELSIIAPLVDRSLLLDIDAYDNRLIAVGERGHVLVSDNDGKDWQQVQVPTRSTLTGVFLLDENNAWAVGHDAVILRTANGGRSWQRVFYAPEQERPLLDIWFADKDYGIAVGAYGLYLETGDGGTSWEERVITEGDFHLNRISPGGPGRLIIAGEAGHLYQSNDNGVHWEPLPSPYRGSIFSAADLGDQTLVIAGLRGHLFKSTDGGQSWDPLQSNTSDMLTDIHRINANDFIVVGLDGAVIVSRATGPLEYYFQPDRKGMTAVISNSRGEFFAVGEGGLKQLHMGTDAPGEPQ